MGVGRGGADLRSLTGADGTRANPQQQLHFHSTDGRTDAERLLGSMAIVLLLGVDDGRSSQTPRP